MASKQNPIRASAEVKALNARIKKLGAEVADLRRAAASIQADKKRREREISALSSQLKALSGKEIELTDHAILRYLERVKGLDIDAVADEMITDALRAQIEALGANGIFAGDGFRYVVENKRVITIKP